MLGAAALLLVVTSALPLLTLLVEALSSSGESTALLRSPRVWLLLIRSISLAAAVTAVAAAVGVPLGLLLGRMDVPGRWLLWLLHAFGMFLPPFVIALGWFHLLGRQGWIGGERTAAVLFSDAGLVLVLGVTFSPIVTSLVALGVMGVDASLEEAARASARPARVLMRVLFPTAWPALGLALIVVFSLALSELGVATFLRVEVFATAVFARLGGIEYAPGEAFTLVLPLIPIALLLLWLERRFSSRRSFAVLGVRGAPRAPMPLGPWKAAVTLTSWLAALISVAPIFALVLRAWRSGDGVGPIFDYAQHAPWNSVAVAGLAATAILAIGIVVGHALARGSRGSRGSRDFRGAALLDALALVSFVTPASVLGVGLIAVWNRPATDFVYTTTAILVLGCVARYAIVGIRAVASTVAQTPRHLEEAAAAAGAGYLRRLLRIVIPARARGVMFAWLLALVFCLRDLETAVIFYPPGREPLTVRIFTLEANGPEAIVAGLAVLHVLVTALCILLGAALMYSWKRP
jgi:iron(III) transport system permease protein